MVKRNDEYITDNQFILNKVNGFIRIDIGSSIFPSYMNGNAVVRQNFTYRYNFYNVLVHDYRNIFMALSEKHFSFS